MVAIERLRTRSRVVAAAAAGRAINRLITDGRVEEPSLVQERIVTQKCSEVAAAAAFLASRSGLRRNRKADEGKWNEQQSERVMVHRMF